MVKTLILLSPLDKDTKRRAIHFFAFLSVVFGSSAKANPALLPDLNFLNEMKPPSSPGQNPLALGLKFYNENYRETTVKKTSKQTHYPSFLLSVRLHKETDHVRGHLDGEGFITVTQSKNRYVNAREAYISTGLKKNPLQFSAGRKKEEWSLLDDHWQLGLWQPRFRWDYFNPDQVGLTGLFSSFESENLSVCFFGSYIAIPELNAPFEEKNGRLESGHPFFTQPPSSAKIFGVDTPVRYKVEMPSVAKTVLRPSGSVMTRIGNHNRQWIKGSYGYLPINQLALNYEGVLSLNNQAAQVTISTRTVYHHVATMEGGVSVQKLKAMVSLMGEQPVEVDAVSSQKTQQQYTPGVLVGPTFVYHLSGSPEHGHNLGLGFLQTWGGTGSDQGPLGRRDQELFESRYPFRQAVSVRWKIPFQDSSREKFFFLSRVVYDFDVQGTLISAEIRYLYDQKWSLGFGADLIGAQKDRAGQGGGEYFSLYRTNDRIRGGIGYVF